MISELFYINNSQVNPPKNWQELMTEINYGKDQFPNNGTISITDFEWCRENYDYLQKYVADGLTGDVGIFEGVPFRIDITNGKIVKTVFAGYIDLTAGAIFTNKKGDLSGLPDGKITAKATSHATVDWLNEVSGFSFEYLATPVANGGAGLITPDMYRLMPYVINTVPNYEQAAIATLMIFTITNSIEKEIEEVYGLLTDAANPFTTVNGILKLLLKIAYLTTLILTLIKLVEDMIKFIISPVKYHAGMYVRDLLTIGAQFLNMKFVSDIWDANSPYYNEFIIPEKLYNPVNKFDTSILGFLKADKNEQIGYFKGSYGQLLDAMKTKCNAKIIVTLPPGGATPTNQGTITLIRKDKNVKPPAYQLPNIYIPEYTYNTDEFQATTLIEYHIDATDTNTEQDYLGTEYEVVCQPKVFNYRPFVMTKNINNVDIPFARASTKTQLTTPEKIIEDFLIVFDDIVNVLVTVVNTVSNAINSTISLTKKVFKFFGIKLNISPIPKMNKLQLSQFIENRLGMMMISSDKFNIAKIFILKEGSQSKYNKIDPSNSDLESARAMWYNFHYVNSFIPTQLNNLYSDRPTGNQYIIKEFPSVPFTWINFLQVIDNNQIFDSNGNPAILESLKFNPYKQIASMKVRFKQLYTLNLIETKMQPTGA